MKCVFAAYDPQNGDFCVKKYEKGCQNDDSCVKKCEKVIKITTFTNFYCGAQNG